LIKPLAIVASKRDKLVLTLSKYLDNELFPGLYDPIPKQNKTADAARKLRKKVRNPKKKDGKTSQIFSRGGEMVDTVDSKSTASNSVRVRVSPAAPVDSIL
jgi:hypothetical protein